MALLDCRVVELDDLRNGMLESKNGSLQLHERQDLFGISQLFLTKLIDFFLELVSRFDQNSRLKL